jgi:DNA replication ATP-dependent helicase Dna2
MNREIMTLSNRLIYEDRLRCGNEEVANRALELKDSTFLRRLHRGVKVGEITCAGDDGGCWLERLADER